MWKQWCKHPQSLWFIFILAVFVLNLLILMWIIVLNIFHFAPLFPQMQPALPAPPSIVSLSLLFNKAQLSPTPLFFSCSRLLSFPIWLGLSPTSRLKGVIKALRESEKKKKYCDGPLTMD